MEIGRFMQHLNRTLKTKTGKPQGATARKAYGAVIKHLKDHPYDVAEMSKRIDKMPRGRTAGFYLKSIRGIVAEMESERRHTESAARTYAKKGNEQLIGDLLKGVLDAKKVSEKAGRR